jgi:hypothetical protein
VCRWWSDAGGWSLSPGHTARLPRPSERHSLGLCHAARMGRTGREAVLCGRIRGGGYALVRRRSVRGIGAGAWLRDLRKGAKRCRSGKRW